MEIVLQARGSTPDPKKANYIPQEPQEQERSQPTNRAGKSLFELNATWAERESYCPRFRFSNIPTPLELFGRSNSSRNP